MHSVSSRDVLGAVQFALVTDALASALRGIMHVVVQLRPVGDSSGPIASTTGIGMAANPSRAASNGP
jgi:hypothetical protein